MFTFLLKSIYLPILASFLCDSLRFSDVFGLSGPRRFFWRDLLRRWFFAFLLLSEIFGGLRFFSARSQHFLRRMNFF